MLDAMPKPMRKVYLSSVRIDFNDVVSVDHMFPGKSCVVHIMDTKTLYSGGGLVEDL